MYFYFIFGVSWCPYITSHPGVPKFQGDIHTPISIYMQNMEVIQYHKD